MISKSEPSETNRYWYVGKATSSWPEIWFYSTSFVSMLLTYYCKSSNIRRRYISYVWVRPPFDCMIFSHQAHSDISYQNRIKFSMLFYFSRMSFLQEIYEHKMHANISGFAVSWPTPKRTIGLRTKGVLKDFKLTHQPTNTWFEVVDRRDSKRPAFFSSQYSLSVMAEC